MTFSRRAVIGGAAAAGLVVAGCAENNTNAGSGSGGTTGGSTGGGDDKSPIKVGAVLDITGAGASLGAPQKDIAELWQDKWDKAGGIGGRKVEVLIRDNRSDPAEAAKIINEFVTSEKVSVIVGPTRTGTSLPIAPIVNQAKVPNLVMASNKATVTDKAGKTLPYSFKPVQNDEVMIERIAEFIGKNNHKRLFLVRDSSAYGEGVKEFLEAKGKANGLTVVGTNKFDTTATEFTAQLTEARDAKPDAIVIWGITPSAASAGKQAAQLAKGTPIYQSAGVANPDFVKVGGPEVNGQFVIAGRLMVLDQLPDSDPSKKVLTDFVKEVKDKTGKEPSTFSGYAYDAFAFVDAALKAVGSDREKIRTYLDTAKLVGVTGSFKYMPDDHAGLDKDAVVPCIIENGKFKFLPGK